MATLKDVAAKAGVSMTTASVVANGRDGDLRISPDTVARVKAAIEELGYQSNQNASRLRRKVPHRTTIAFFWPNDHHIDMMGPRVYNITRAIREYDLDYKLVIETYEIGHLSRSLHHLTDNRYDGAIIGGASDDDLIALEEMNIQIPVVLLNRSSLKYSSVGIDQAQAGIQAATLIFRKGYTDCAVIRNENRNRSMDARYKSFITTCRQLGVNIELDHIFSGQATYAGGAKAAVEYCSLRNRPSVVFFEYERMAMGALKVFRDAGLSIPKDLELLSFGMTGSTVLDYLNPTISCISIPPNVDKQAVALIARLREEGQAAPVSVELEPLIEFRESFRVR